MLRPKLALAGLLLLPLAAKADTFNFSIAGSGGGYTGSGVLTASKQSGGAFLVTAITGTGVTGLIAANDPNYGYGNDNLLFPANARFFDVNGIAFYGSFGSVNLFSTVAGYEVQGFDASSDYFDTPVTLAVTATTPEPSSVTLSVTGFLGATLLLFRKRTTTSQLQGL